MMFAILSTAALSATVLIAGTAYWIPKWLLFVGDMLFPDVITRCSNKDVALTIDDVPSATTAELLQIIDQHAVPATLFVISGQVRETDKQLLINAVKSGHALGNHGHFDRMHARLSTEEFKKEVLACDKLINEIYNAAKIIRSCKLFRPGCGVFTTNMLRILTNMGYTVVLGSVYPHDVAIRSNIINSWFIRRKLEPSHIIILHDRVWTLDLLRDILPWTKLKGFNFETLHQENTEQQIQLIT